MFDRFVPNRGRTVGDDLLGIRPRFLESAQVKLMRQEMVQERNMLMFGPKDSHEEVQGIPQQNQFCEEVRKTSLSVNLERILDAPNLADDFYTHPIDMKKGTVIVCLDTNIYIKPKTQKAQLVESGHASYTCCGFSPNSGLFAVGTSNALLKLFDVEKTCQIRSWDAPTEGFACLEWHNAMIYCGSRDSQLIQVDVRAPRLVYSPIHDQSICSIKLDESQRKLAVGGNNVWIYDLRKKEYTIGFDRHTASVKGLAWHPRNPNWIISGGGYKDGRVVVWDSLDNKVKDYRAMNAQINSLICVDDALIIASGSELQVLSLGGLNPCANVHCKHTGRVIQCVRDGDSMISASVDERLFLWKLQNKSIKKKHINQEETLR